MRDDDNHRDKSQQRKRTRRRAGLLAAALACLVLLAAACSSSGGHHSAAGAGSGSPKQSLLAFSQCMRAHGITGFPDPNSQGQIGLSPAPGSGINPSSPQFKAAKNACQSLMPPPVTNNPGQAAKMKAANLKYAQCMRAHGITNFPDPGSNGQIALNPQPGTNLDPNNPLFQAANKACAQYMPGGSVSTSGGGGGA
jgi:hypothetical protein